MMNDVMMMMMMMMMMMVMMNVWWVAKFNSFNPAIPPNPNHLPAPSRSKLFGCLQTLSLSWPPHGKGIESVKLSSSPKHWQILQLCWKVLCSGSDLCNDCAPGWLHRPSCAVPPFLRGGTCAMPSMPSDVLNGSARRF